MVANPLLRALVFFAVIWASWYASFLITGTSPLGNVLFPTGNTNTNQFLVFMVLSVPIYLILARILGLQGEAEE